MWGWLDALRSLGDFMSMESSRGSGTRTQFQKGGLANSSFPQFNTVFLTWNCMRLGSQYEAGMLIWKDLNCCYRLGPGKKYMSPHPNPRTGPGENEWEQGQRNGKAGERRVPSWQRAWNKPRNSTEKDSSECLVIIIYNKWVNTYIATLSWPGTWEFCIH